MKTLIAIIAILIFILCGCVTKREYYVTICATEGSTVTIEVLADVPKITTVDTDADANLRGIIPGFGM